VQVSGLRLVVPEPTADRLVEVVVRGGSDSRAVTPRADGTAAFAPLRASSFSVSLVLSPAPSDGTAAPVAVTELGLRGAPAPGAGPVALPCGRGPVLRVGGTAVQTSVSVSVGDLVEGAPVPATVCAPAPEVSLPAGQHRVVAEPSEALDVERARLTGPDAAAAVPAPPGAVTVTGWAPELRTVVLDGAAGVLALAEGFNEGWAATVEGRPLEPVRVDGWRQAWWVPSGTSGEVVLDYRPGRWHRAGLLVGVLGLGLVGALAAVPARRGRPDLPPAVAGRGRWVGGDAATLAAAVLLAGAAGLAGWAAARVLGARRPVHATALGGVLLAAAAAALVAVGTRGQLPGVLEQTLAIALVVTAVRPALADQRDRRGDPGRGAPSAAPEPPAGATTAPPPPGSRWPWRPARARTSR
jgi:arabinofuranan 3-O-arabinosyltransferase